MKKPESILFIQHATEVSGSLMSLLYTVQALQENNNYKVNILCKSKEIAKWYQQKNISAEHVPFISVFGHCSGHTYQLFNLIDIFKFLFRLLTLPHSIYKQYSYFNRSEANIIHLNSSTLLASAIAARCSHKIVFWHIREILSNGTIGLRKYIWRKLYLKLAHKIICISELEANAISNNPNNKIEIIYNFIPFDHFQPTLDRDHFLKEINLSISPKYILTLGGTNPIKLTSCLLKTLNYLEDNYHIIIGGDSNYYFKFKNSKKEKLISILKILIGSRHQIEYWKILNLEKKFKERIHFIGIIQNVPNAIQSCTALYFGFTIPHFPRPVYEAWFLKKPVLSFSILNSINQIEHNKNGLLVRNGDSQELAKQIIRLENSDLYTTLCTNGHSKAIEKFDLSKNIQKLVDLYASVKKG